jgi:predicted RecA/RadA family phage recombinase
MFNFKQTADVINITVEADYTSGTLLKIGDDFFGVCHQNLTAGETGAFMVAGVFVAATADGTIAIGDKLYLIGGAVGTASTAGNAIGTAWTAATDGGEVRVAINQ